MSDEAAAPVKPGDVLLGKYVVEKVIGAGGMGVVVAVRHQELHELYAMKFMLPQALRNAEHIERFVREARAAARLKSEHVAKVTDVGRLESGSPYMVMEFLKGKDLEGVLEERGPLPPIETATYVLQACDAIAEAHEAGVVHRDLKPANLFLTTRANGSPCVKVLDFGISKSRNPDDGGGSMTRTTAIMGSPYYMSPEQMRSSKNVDGRTDIWALGVILYQLSTGRVPFPGETITEVCSAVLADEPPPIINVMPGASPELDAIIRRCLAKNPDHRFQNARELGTALAAVAGTNPGTSGLNLQMHTGTVAMQAGPVVAPGATQAMRNTGGGYQQPGGVGATTGGQQAWGAVTPPPAVTPPKPSSNVGAIVGAIAGVLLLAGAAGAFVIMKKGDAAKDAEKADAHRTEVSEPTAPGTAGSTPTAAPTADPTSAPTAEASAGASASASAEPIASAVASAEPTSAPIAGRPRPKPTATAAATPPPTATAKPTATGASTAKPHGIF